MSTVGPYALHGEPLVKACAEAGTDYCDLAGEVQWIRRMIQRYEPAARASGARIVHCCGFDSIPSDLGVFFLQQQARERLGQPCTRVAMRVRSLRGGISGGTAASLLNVVREAAADPALRRELADPYSLCPPAPGPRPRQPTDRRRTLRRAVRRLGRAVRDERDQHACRAAQPGPARTPPTATVSATTRPSRPAAACAGDWPRSRWPPGLAGFLLAGAVPPTRWMLRRWVLPAPGEGPSPEAQRRGHFDLRFFGLTADGRTLRTRLTGDRDPGYGSTARMLGQAAACLAQDFGDSRRSAGAGGFPTPASLFGSRLVERLRAHSGLRFEVLDEAAAR